MKSGIYTYLFLLFFSLTLISCVSKKKYLEVQETAGKKEATLNAEKARLSSLNDSLRLVIISKDSLIDSMLVKLNSVKKEKTKTVAVSSKKSTMSREQECEKKSLFIYNFTKLVEWPIEYNGTEFVIGVAGDDYAVQQLQNFMAQKKVSGKKIIVEKYKKGARYNVVYITSSEINSFSTIRNAVKKSKTLLVTDDAADGSHISFMLDQDKVRYMVDKIAIEKAGLKVGQELMRYSG